ncbi:rhodanese-like domain-containing protein 8, chloroplastic [Panicum miliaceum]|uniref:Rhodanese-like domain-containing protein 8, chloroplastic n=1 Tax=Panicum miliaceum TaxID=4540 RepID=A0A3L6SFP0_PANMI|nr:rhodanese-like domain-containing protein 8, chloroplastic [Panicum miliaceum]
MASAVHHNCHRLLALLLRPLPAPARHPRLSFSPRPAGVRSFFPAPGCRLGTHAVVLAEPELVPPEEEEEEDDDARFVVVTFYKFVPLEDPRTEVASHLHFLQGRDIHGRIYLNEQGINAQYSGPRKDAAAYADWVKKDHRFRDMLVQTSPALTGHAFPRLKLRYKPSLVQSHIKVINLAPYMITHASSAACVVGSSPPGALSIAIAAFLVLIFSDGTGTGTGSHTSDGSMATVLDQLEGGSLHLPLLDPSMRAMPLTPSKWKERLEARACLDVSSSEMSGRKLLLLDVRNDYEWDVGHFEGAQRPNVDCFRSTSFGLSGEVSDPLNGVDKEKTDILMYCTGGIRCDVYSTILRKKGF